MSATNAVDRLRAAGINVDAATDGQREVLASLSPDEVSVLTAVRDRLAAEGFEVEGHMTDQGGLFW